MQLNCKNCGAVLMEGNQYLSYKKEGKSLCKECDRNRNKEWRKLPDTKSISYCHVCNVQLCSETWGTGAKKNKVRICKACQANEHHKWVRRLKLEIIAAYGGKCVLCGETQFEFLSIDHKLDNGNTHRASLGKTRRAGTPVYRELKKQGFPKESYQLLCMSCQFRKRDMVNKGKQNKAREWRRARKERVLRAYSPELNCACCGETDFRVLQLDHGWNDGAEVNRRLGIKSSQVYDFIEKNKFPKNLGLRVLCSNCNHAHGCYKYCPHRNLAEDQIPSIPTIESAR